MSHETAISNIVSAFPTSTLPKSTLNRYLNECKTIDDVNPRVTETVSRPNNLLLEKITACISQDRFLSPRQIANHITAEGLKVSKNTVKKYIKHYLKMDSVSCTVIPHILTPAIRNIRVSLARVQSAILQELSSVNFIPLFTMDETWIHYKYYPKRCFLFRGEPRPTFPQVQTHDDKVMMTTIINVKGINYWTLPKGESITSQNWNEKTIRFVQGLWKAVWTSLTIEEKEKVSIAVKRACTAAHAIIKQEKLKMLPVLPGRNKLAPSEQLLVTWKTGRTKKQNEQVNDADCISSSSDDEHPSLIVNCSHPRKAKVRSQTILSNLGSSWLRSIHESDGNYSSANNTSNMDTDITPCFIHYDNAGPHNSFLARKFLSESECTIRMAQPPYSPDLAVCDFLFRNC